MTQALMPDTENDDENRFIYKDESVGVVKMPNHNRADRNKIVGFSMAISDDKGILQGCPGRISIQHICLFDKQIPCSGKNETFCSMLEIYFEFNYSKLREAFELYR